MLKVRKLIRRFPFGLFDCFGHQHLDTMDAILCCVVPSLWLCCSFFVVAMCCVAMCCDVLAAVDAYESIGNSIVPTLLLLC